jgi:hypothetical protein
MPVVEPTAAAPLVPVTSGTACRCPSTATLPTMKCAAVTMAGSTPRTFPA